MTKILHAVKGGLQSYCDKVYSHGTTSIKSTASVAYNGLHPLLYHPNNNALLFFLFCLVMTKITHKRCLCLSFVWNFSVKNKIMKSYCASRYVVCDSTRLYRQFSIRNSTPQPLKAFLSYRKMCRRTDVRYTIILYVHQDGRIKTEREV